MRWIKSNDLRLIPAGFFNNCSNPDLTFDQWQKVANATFGSLLIFALYGCDKQGKIAQAIQGYLNPLDGCMYLEQFFNGASVDDPGVRHILKEWKEQSERKVKVLTAVELEV